MIYGRFRAGETSAELTWIGGASGPLQRGPATAAGPATGIATGRSRPPASGGRDLVGQVIRSRSILGPAGVLRYPSTSLLRATPGSASVIPPATEADLPNRQGPCLRNSSPATPLRRQKCLFPDRENATYGSIKAVTTHRSKACQASSQSGLYHPARRWHHPPPTAVRDGKRSNSFPSRPTPREAGGPPGTQEGPRADTGPQRHAGARGTKGVAT
jgi:hypothetical protein